MPHSLLRFFDIIAGRLLLSPSTFNQPYRWLVLKLYRLQRFVWLIWWNISVYQKWYIAELNYPSMANYIFLIFTNTKVFHRYIVNKYTYIVSVLNNFLRTNKHQTFPKNIVCSQEIQTIICTKLRRTSICALAGYHSRPMYCVLCCILCLCPLFACPIKR